MRVYIAGALSSREDETRNPSKVVTDYIQNMSQMCLSAISVYAIGAYPYVPGLDFLLGFRAGTWEEDDYRKLGMAFLEVCDAVLVISMSYGVQQEINRARELGIPVFCDIEGLQLYLGIIKGG